MKGLGSWASTAFFFLFLISQKMKPLAYYQKCYGKKEGKTQMNLVLFILANCMFFHLTFRH